MYERSKFRQEIIKKLDKQIYGNINFKPNFNTNYVIESTFDERLEYFKNKSQEKKKELEKELKTNCHSQNRKGFFTPNLISKQIPRENNSNSDVYDYMYSFAKMYNSNKINRSEEEIKKIKKNSSSVHTTYDSDVIINNLKYQNFEKIFQLLDSDQDNELSKFCIDVKKLPDNVKNILKVIIREIIEDDQNLNKDEFILACDHLFEVLFILLIFPD